MPPFLSFLDIHHIRPSDIALVLALGIFAWSCHHYDLRHKSSLPPPPYDSASVSLQHYNASMAHLARVIADKEAQVQTLRAQVRDLRGVLSIVQNEHTTLLQRLQDQQEGEGHILPPPPPFFRAENL
jgi:hypothetical protein